MSTPTVSDTSDRTGDDNQDGPHVPIEDLTTTTTKSEGSASESLGTSEVNMKAPPNNDAKKRFFIMKSLAREDLELSVQNGHWVTQDRNETILNKAFIVWNPRPIVMTRHLT